MAKVAISENALTVLNYLKENDGVNMTAADIAEALGMDVKKINGVITSGLQRKGYAERIPSVIDVDGTPKAIKFVKATAEGLAYDHASAQAQDAAAAAAAASAE